MADLPPIIETMEHRWMRAWIARDFRTLKAMTSGKFRMVIGSKPCVILDTRSWLEAAKDRFRCTSYRFDDIYVHDLGSIAVFATQMDVRASIDDHDWTGPVWITDVWRKSPVRRKWRIVERMISRLEGGSEIPAAMKALQLWR